MPIHPDPTILFYVNALTRLVFAADSLIKPRHVRTVYRPPAVGTSLIINVCDHISEEISPQVTCATRAMAVRARPGGARCRCFIFFH